MTLLFCGRPSNIPRYLPRTTRAASLLCILMRSAPVELCDTAEIAAAVSSSSLSLGTSKTALTITLTRWPSSSSSRTRTLGPHVTALLMLEKAIAFNSRKTRSRLTSARSAARPDDLLNSRRNPFISFHPAGIAVVGFVPRQNVGLGGSFAPGQGLCEALVAQIGKGPMHLPTAFYRRLVQVGIKASPFWSEKQDTSSASAALQSVGIINGHGRLWGFSVNLAYIVAGVPKDRLGSRYLSQAMRPTMSVASAART